MMSMAKTGKGFQDSKGKRKISSGYGGHFRAVQAFKFLGNNE